MTDASHDTRDEMAKLREDVQRLRSQRNELWEGLNRLFEHMGAHDLDGAIRHWQKALDDRDRLEKQVKLLRSVQLEAVEFVDRFQPTMDNEFKDLFQKVNGRIGPFVKKVQAFAQGNPFQAWDVDEVLFRDSIHQDVLSNPRCIAESKTSSSVYIKLLLYQAMWRFLLGTLFDTNKPFAAYHGVRGVDQYVHNAFMALFHADEEAADGKILGPKEESAKWRAATVARLDTIDAESGGAGEQKKVDELVADFVHFVVEKMHYQSEPEVRDLLKADTKVGKSLRSVFEAAVELARLMAGQRAVFRLCMPRVAERDTKVAGDAHFTTLGGTGVAVSSADEGEDEDGEAKIMFCVTPMLVKWGNGQGKNLKEHMILVKSFVQCV
jgi:hypothetical protein